MIRTTSAWAYRRIGLRRKYSIHTQQVNTISYFEKLLDVIIKGLYIILLYLLYGINRLRR